MLYKRIRPSVAPALMMALVALLTSVPAVATPACKKVHSHLFIEADPNPTCGSPIDLCGIVTLQGNVQATSNFIATDLVTTDDTMVTGVVVVTVENTFRTSRGDFHTIDAIVLAPSGEFSEVDVVVGGTGDYADATGVLTATGTFADGFGEGVLEGEICTPR